MRSARPILALAVGLGAGCAGPAPEPVADAALTGRDVVTIREPLLEPGRMTRVYTSGSPSLFGLILDAVATGVDAGIGDIDDVPAPSLDVASRAEARLVAGLEAQKGAVAAGIWPMSLPADRTATDHVEELRSAARARGFDGLALDVWLRDLQIVSSGSGLGLKTETFRIAGIVYGRVVDLATGEVVTSAGCSSSQPLGSLETIETENVRFAEQRARAIARRGPDAPGLPPGSIITQRLVLISDVCSGILLREMFGIDPHLVPAPVVVEPVSGAG